MILDCVFASVKVNSKGLPMAIYFFVFLLSIRIVCN